MPKVQKFAVEGYFAFYRDAKDMEPSVALREFIQNSYEANSTKVEVRLDEEGISILDDGIGMTMKELLKNFSKFHVTGKKLGDNANFGIGAKMAFLALGGPDTTITSRKGGPRGKAHTIRLGREVGPEETGGWEFGCVPNQHGELVYEAPLARDWSTVVAVRYKDFDLEDVLKAINGRYLRPPHTVVRSGGASKVVGGYISCMERSATKVMRHEMNACTLYWGERANTPEATAVLKDEWEGPPLAFAFGGEVFLTKKSKAAQKWLDGAGLSVGSSALFVLIEPKGKNMRWNNARTNVTGVDFDAIQEEIAEALDSGALPELAAFREAFEAQHTASVATYDASVEAGLASMLELLGMRLPGGGPVTPPKNPSGKPKGSGGGGGGGGGKPRRKGLPLPMPADEAVTLGEPALYSSLRHTLYVWYEHPLFKEGVASGKTRKAREELKALIGVELAFKWATVTHCFGEPSAEEVSRLAAELTLFRLAAARGINFRIGDLFGR